MGTITLTEEELATLIEQAVTEALSEVSYQLEQHERRLAATREYQRHRRSTDPEYRKETDDKRKAAAKTPEARAKRKEYLARRSDDVKARDRARRNAHHKERMKDPEYREHIKQLKQSRRERLRAAGLPVN